MQSTTPPKKQATLAPLPVPEDVAGRMRARGHNVEQWSKELNSLPRDQAERTWANVIDYYRGTGGASDTVAAYQVQSSDYGRRAQQGPANSQWSIFDDFKGKFANGIVNLGQGLSVALPAAADLAMSALSNPSDQSWYRQWQDTANAYFDKVKFYTSPEAEAAVWDDKAGINWRATSAMMGNTLSQLLLTFAPLGAAGKAGASLATLGTASKSAAAVGFLQSLPDYQQEVLRAGYSRNQAALVAPALAGLQAVLEAVGMEAFTKVLGVGRKAALPLLRQMGRESMGDAFAQLAARKAAGGALTVDMLADVTNDLGRGFLGRLAKTSAGRAALRGAVGAATEGGEEVLQTVTETVAKNLFDRFYGYGEGADGGKGFNVDVFSQQTAIEAIAGGIMGGLIGGTMGSVFTGGLPPVLARQTIFGKLDTDLRGLLRSAPDAALDEGTLATLPTFKMLERARAVGTLDEQQYADAKAMLGEMAGVAAKLAGSGVTDPTVRFAAYDLGVRQQGVGAKMQELQAGLETLQQYAEETPEGWVPKKGLTPADILTAQRLISQRIPERLRVGSELTTAIEDYSRRLTASDARQSVLPRYGADLDARADAWEAMGIDPGARLKERDLTGLKRIMTTPDGAYAEVVDRDGRRGVVQVSVTEEGRRDAVEADRDPALKTFRGYRLPRAGKAVVSFAPVSEARQEALLDAFDEDGAPVQNYDAWRAAEDDRRRDDPEAALKAALEAYRRGAEALPADASDWDRADLERQRQWVAAAYRSRAEETGSYGGYFSDLYDEADLLALETSAPQLSGLPLEAQRRVADLLEENTVESREAAAALITQNTTPTNDPTTPDQSPAPDPAAAIAAAQDELAQEQQQQAAGERLPDLIGRLGDLIDESQQGGLSPERESEIVSAIAEITDAVAEYDRQTFGEPEQQPGDAGSPATGDGAAPDAGNETTPEPGPAAGSDASDPAAAPDPQPQTSGLVGPRRTTLTALLPQLPAEVQAQALEMAAEYVTFYEGQNLSATEQVLMAGLGRVKNLKEEFGRYDSRDNYGEAIARAYQGSKKDPGDNIDAWAQTLSTQSGLDITEQDIIDFIRKFPSGPASARTAGLAPIAARFEALVGKRLEIRAARTVLATLQGPEALAARQSETDIELEAAVPAAAPVTALEPLMAGLDAAGVIAPQQEAILEAIEQNFLTEEGEVDWVGVVDMLARNNYFTYYPELKNVTLPLVEGITAGAEVTPLEAQAELDALAADETFWDAFEADNQAADWWQQVGDEYALSPEEYDNLLATTNEQTNQTTGPDAPADGSPAETGQNQEGPRLSGQGTGAPQGPAPAAAADAGADLARLTPAQQAAVARARALLDADIAALQARRDKVARDAKKLRADLAARTRTADLFPAQPQGVYPAAEGQPTRFDGYADTPVATGLRPEATKGPGYGLGFVRAGSRTKMWILPERADRFTVYRSYMVKPFFESVNEHFNAQTLEVIRPAEFAEEGGALVLKEKGLVYYANDGRSYADFRAAGGAFQSDLSAGQTTGLEAQEAAKKAIAEKEARLARLDEEIANLEASRPQALEVAAAAAARQTSLFEPAPVPGSAPVRENRTSATSEQGPAAAPDIDKEQLAGKLETVIAESPSRFGLLKYEDVTQVRPSVTFTDLPEGIDESSREARSQLARDQENTPPAFTTYPPGSLAVDRFGEISQLREVPVAEISASNEGTQRPGTVDKYVRWLQNGNTPPPLKAVERYENGRAVISVIDGNHRVMAARQAGMDSLPVWVSLTDPTNPFRPVYARDLIAEQYLQTKSDGSNSELVRAVNEAIFFTQAIDENQLSSLADALPLETAQDLEQNGQSTLDCQ